MKTINIQSISDIITNSSTEVFVVYSKSNIADIKNLVNTIISLIDVTKTFDDYFDIKMLINYEEIYNIFEKFFSNEEGKKLFPEFEEYSRLDYEDSIKYVENLSEDRLSEIVEWANERSYYGRKYQLYEGFSVTAKKEDGELEKAANIINKISHIFDIDYISDY